MTESSGVFTFPSTGYWYIGAHFYYYLNGANEQAYGYINSTTDGSTMAKAVYCAAQLSSLGNTGITSSYGSLILDVTSTSNVQVSFSVAHPEEANTYNDGNTGYNKTSFTFLRLGDT